MCNYLFQKTGLILAIFLSALLLSCSHQSSIPSKTDISNTEIEDAFEDLTNTILKFEGEEDYLINDTKSGFWRKLACVVGTDALHLLIGNAIVPGLGILSSATSSIIAAFVQFATFEENDNLTKSTNSDWDAIINCLGEMGEEHNLLLHYFYANCAVDYSSMTIDEIRDYVYSSLYSAYSQLYPSASMPALIECKNAYFTLPKVELYSTVDELGVACIENVPSLVNEITVTQHCINTMSSIEDGQRVIQYCEGVSRILDDSLIPEASKYEIKSSLSVSAFSKLYWDEDI